MTILKFVMSHPCAFGVLFGVSVFLQYIIIAIFCGISFASFSYFLNVTVGALLIKPCEIEIIQLESTFHPQMIAKSSALVFWIVKKQNKTEEHLWSYLYNVTFFTAS